MASRNNAHSGLDSDPTSHQQDRHDYARSDLFNYQGRGQRQDRRAASAHEPDRRAQNNSGRNRGLFGSHSLVPSSVLSSSIAPTGTTGQTMATSEILDPIQDIPELREMIKNDTRTLEALTSVIQRRQRQQHQQQNSDKSRHKNKNKNKTRPQHYHMPPSEHQHYQHGEGSDVTARLGSLLLEPPPLRDEPWADAEAKQDMNKTIDNIAYYQALSARYAAQRRKDGGAEWAGDDATAASWVEQEQWAVQSAAYWAGHRLKMMEQGLARK